MRSSRAAIGVFLPAVGLRILHFALFDSRFDDWHWGLATNVLTTGSLEYEGVSTDFDPLYPLFIAAVRWIAGDRPVTVLVVQGLVAAFGAVLLFWLGEALSGRRRVGIIAGCLYAVYPLLIRHATDGTESALLTTLLIAFAYLFVIAETPRGAAAAGVCLGLATLTRAAVLPLVPLAIILMWRDGRRRAAVGLLASILVVAPFTWRSYALNGTLLPTRHGLNLFISNSPYEVIPDYSPDILGPYALATLSREGFDEVRPSPARDRAVDAMYLRRAVEQMRQRPWRTAWLKLKNVWYVFTPRLVPYYETYDASIVLEEDGRFRVESAHPRPLLHRLAYSIPYMFVVGMIVVAVAYRRIGFKREAILWAIVAVFVAVHALYFPSMRYRSPMEFVLLYYAAVGMDAVWTRVGNQPPREELVRLS